MAKAFGYLRDTSRGIQDGVHYTMQHLPGNQDYKIVYIFMHAVMFVMIINLTSYAIRS